MSETGRNTFNCFHLQVIKTGWLPLGVERLCDQCRWKQPRLVGCLSFSLASVKIHRKIIILYNTYIIIIIIVIIKKYINASFNLKYKAGLVIFKILFNKLIITSELQWLTAVCFYVTFVLRDNTSAIVCVVRIIT